MSDLQKHIQEELKLLDPERYLACLYLPDDIRDLAMALYAFDAEIARISDLVSDPMPGEIRIQWWRDLLKSDGNTGSGPLAEALLHVCSEYDLPRDVLDNTLEARIFDLYQDPMPDLGTYEGYLGETVSSFLQMIAVASGLERSSDLADACGHAGVAIGISKHLSFCAQARARRQVYFPLSILKEQRLDREHWLANENHDQQIAVLRTMVLLAKDHLSKAKTAIAELPSDKRTVFLPIVFTENLLKVIEQNPINCLHSPVVLSAIKRQWLAFRGVGKL